MPQSPPQLVWADGRPMRVEVLSQEIAAPTMAGVRSIVSGHPAQGLTPPRLARLLRDAEQGDATAYYELAEEMEEKDLHYLSVLGTRKRQVAQLPIEVIAAGEGEQEQGDAQLVRDWLNRDLLEAELFDILDAVGKGVSATELIWDLKPSSWLPRALKWRDPRFFEFDRVTGEELMLRDLAGPVPLPPAKFIVHTHAAKSGLPVRGGLARVVAWGYMFKNYAIKDWVAFLETYGMPYRVGRYDNGETEANIRKLMQAVADIGSDAAAVFPKTMDLEFVDTKRGTAPNDLWRAKAEYVDSQVSKAVLGQTGTTDTKSGGIGDGGNAVHNDVRGDIERADAKLLAATLNRDLVPALVMFNRGPRERYPRIRIGRPEARDVVALVNAAEALIPLGVEVGADDMRDAAGLPAPKPGARLLQMREPAPQSAVEGFGVPGAAETVASALLGPLKASQWGIRALASGATGTSAPPARQPDAIEAAADEALSDWVELIDPSIAAVEKAAADAANLPALRDVLAGLLDQMGAEAFVEQLARGMFAAQLAGDASIGGQ